MPALIIVDIQNDYFPGGRMTLVDIEQARRKRGPIARALPQIRPADVSYSAHLG
ncbi:MAG: hypothetical protein U0805_14545 [Pirellulales bacterium]